MKLVLAVLAVCAAATACTRAAAPAATTAPCPVCAAPTAAKPFAMRTYSLVMLRRGPAWTAEVTAEVKRISAGHMANIKAMARAGKLVLAGPFEVAANQRDAYAGLFIFDVASADELKTLLATDPAIAAGRFIPEIMTWYGPVGLTYDGREESLRDEDGNR